MKDRGVGRVDSQKGALQRAPFVLGLVVVVILLSGAAMFRGWWLQRLDDEPMISILPSTFQSTKPTKGPLPIEQVIDQRIESTAQKEAGRVAGLFFSFLHQNGLPQEKRLKEIKTLTIETVFQEMEQNFETPMEPVRWGKIRVVTIEKLDPDYWSFLVAGVTHDQVDNSVQIQVRKVAGEWRVVSIDDIPQ